MRLLAFLLLALGLAPAPAVAQPPAGVTSAGPAIISSGPERVSVTAYRDRYRKIEDMALDNLGGFALVTETRTLRLPKGPAVIRFAGVAKGIIPVSAVIEGLPGGTVEKNRDANLLSPASLVDGSLGRVVTLVRTDPVTGQQRRERATIIAGTRMPGFLPAAPVPTYRPPEPVALGSNTALLRNISRPNLRSTPGGDFARGATASEAAPGIVLQTAAGIETLRCAGLPETLHFSGVPDGLSAEPMLSVSTVTPSERTVTVILSYLATGFDWRASYVVNLAPDGRSLDLFAWLTLANGNPEPFADADVQAVAGRINRAAFARVAEQVSGLSLTCYPLGITTPDLGGLAFLRPYLGDTINPALLERVEISYDGAAAYGSDAIGGVVNFVTRLPEDLGDLKLFRVPEQVTVAPRSQKQVALLERSGVRFTERSYRLAVNPDGPPDVVYPAQIMLRLHNVKEDGLGLALPAGTTALYRGGPGADARLLVGTGTIGDYAEGQTLRIAAGFSSQVLVVQRVTGEDEKERFTVTVTNANPVPVTIEVPVDALRADLVEAVVGKLGLVDGVATWTATLPANGRGSFVYRIKSPQERR